MYRLLNGQPYLTRRWLSEMTDANVPFDTLLASAAANGGPFGDHLNRLLSLVNDVKGATEAVVQAICDGRCSDHNLFYRLRSAGIIVGPGTTTGFNSL